MVEQLRQLCAAATSDYDYLLSNLWKPAASQLQQPVRKGGDLAAYQQQSSQLPMEFSLAYRERFDGAGPSSGQANPVLYTRWVVAGMKFLF